MDLDKDGSAPKAKPLCSDEIPAESIPPTNLAQHALPTPISHQESSPSIADTLNPSMAIKHLLELPCFSEARTVLFTADNSLAQLRCLALQQGKKLLVATDRLRRGFVILNPHRIPEDCFALASSVEGMERDGVGRYVTLAQLQDEGFSVDLMVIASKTADAQGVRMRSRADGDVAKITWMMLVDREVLKVETPVVMVADECQIHQEEEVADQTEDENDLDSLQCDYVVTAGRVVRVEKGTPRSLPAREWLEEVGKELIHATLPLQELKGIKVMEKIMGKVNFQQEMKPKVEPDIPPAEAQMGIDIVSRLMKGYKA